MDILHLLAKELLSLDDQIELVVEILDQDAGMPFGFGQAVLELLAERLRGPCNDLPNLGQRFSVHDASRWRQASV